jgi:hypothetical protein
LVRKHYRHSISMNANVQATLKARGK